MGLAEGDSPALPTVPKGEGPLKERDLVRFNSSGELYAGLRGIDLLDLRTCAGAALAGSMGHCSLKRLLWASLAVCGLSGSLAGALSSSMDSQSASGALERRWLWLKSKVPEDMMSKSL